MDMGVMGRGGARRRTRRRQMRMAQAREQASAQPQASGGTEANDLLQMLKSLHAAGLLTDEELQAKKSMLVERM